MKKLFVAILASVLLVPNASAQFNGFPGEIQKRIDSGDFVITSADTLGLGIDSVSPCVGAYFLYTDTTQSPPEQRVIIRYNIGGDSLYAVQIGGQARDDIPMTGIVHLDASQEYDGPSFDFKLYLEDMDQADEIIDSFFFNESIRLAYTTVDALLMGEGSYIECLEYDDKDCYYQEFDLSSPDQPLICLGFGCQVGATLWMTRIGYAPSGTGFAIEIDPFAFGQTQFPPLFEQMQSADNEPYGGKYDTSQLLLQRFELASVVPGDVNRDGSVDLLDVDRFVELLASTEYRFEADINKDLNFNLLDVPGFVFLLSQ